MNNVSDGRDGVFHRAWEIINQDTSIPLDEKKGILRLIQVLLEAAESSSSPRDAKDQIKTFTQEVISRHSLMMLVKQQADELDALKRISLNLTSSLDLQTVLDAVVNEAMSLVKNSRTAHIFLYSNSRLEFGASLNSEGVKNRLISVPRADGLTNSVARSGTTIIIDNMVNHPIYRNAPKDWTGSVIGVPLKFNDSIVGVMNLSRSVTGIFSKADLRLIGLLADQAAVAISNASLHKQVTELANTDSLTGLPNRRALDERLQDELSLAKQMNSQIAVVMMDLDGFKGVNDIYGHAVGDKLLKSLFNSLSENMRDTDFLARYGGDELTLVIRDAGLGIAEAVTLKILELMKNYEYPFPDEAKIRLGISAGIAIYPNHAHTAGDLLRTADTALYQAKKHNRGSFLIASKATGPLHPLTISSE